MATLAILNKRRRADLVVLWFMTVLFAGNVASRVQVD